MDIENKQKMNASQLKHTLEIHGIDTSMWGKSNAKNLEDLAIEIANNDCNLKFINGALQRFVTVLYILITKGEKKILFEKEQVLPDGRIRKRNIPLAEKITPDEDTENIDKAILRAIDEELSFIGSPGTDVTKVSHECEILHNSMQTKIKGPIESHSYPSLKTTYSYHFVQCTVKNLPDGEFQTYEERDDGYLITKWHWVTMEEAIKLNPDMGLYFNLEACTIF